MVSSFGSLQYVSGFGTGNVGAANRGIKWIKEIKACRGFWCCAKHGIHLVLFNDENVSKSYLQWSNILYLSFYCKLCIISLLTHLLHEDYPINIYVSSQLLTETTAPQPTEGTPHMTQGYWVGKFHVFGLYKIDFNFIVLKRKLCLKVGNCSE